MEHPIQGLMDTAMKNIRAMVDVNTIIGQPVNTADGTVIIPVSTVSFGFGAGGSDFGTSAANSHFGGGAGGGAKVKPVAFLVVNNGNIRIMPISSESTPVDKIIDLMPDMVDKVNGVVQDFSAKMDTKKKDKAEKKAKDDKTPEVDPYGV